MAERKEELKSLLMKVKEESEKAGLKLNTGKTIAFTGWTFVGTVMSLLLNMLSRLVITFLHKEEVSFNFLAAVMI